MREQDNATIIMSLDVIAEEGESVEGDTIRYWANHAARRIESQAVRIEALDAQIAKLGREIDWWRNVNLALLEER